jgi:hypothetical protein
MHYPKTAIATFLTGAIIGGTLVWARADDKSQATSTLQAKLAAAQEVFKIDEQRRAAGIAGRDDEGAEFQHTWSVRLMEAEREAANANANANADADARRQAVQHHLDRMKARAKSTENLYSVGNAQKVDVLAYRYFVAEAERWLQEADRKP